MKLAPATDIGPRPQNWLRAEDRAKVHRPHPPRWIRQVHSTASSESLCGSGINTIAAVPHPKVPFAQNLFPFWEESSPLTHPPPNPARFTQQQVAKAFPVQESTQLRQYPTQKYRSPKICSHFGKTQSRWRREPVSTALRPAPDRAPAHSAPPVRHSPIASP
jgi:hypothetical protein